MKLIAFSWQPDWAQTPDHWQDRYRAALADADADRDSLVVFPEYAALEAAFYGDVSLDARGWMTRGADHFDAYCDGIRTLVAETGATILGGSGFARSGDGIVNRALFCGPEGEGYVEKRTPTPYERAIDMAAGAPTPLFDTRFGKVAALICYDSEFPLLSRRYADAGAEILLVPSCTDTEHGAMRVEIGCRARALEGQMIVAMSPLVGEVPECDVVDVNFGQAGIFAPPDGGFPASGILATGTKHFQSTAVLDTLTESVAEAHRGGAVSVKTHWPETETGRETGEKAVETLKFI